MPKRQTPESSVLKQITDWLTAERIWFERRNTGASLSTYKGKSRLTRFSRPGTADIMATTFNICGCGGQGFVRIIWIEVKSAKGKQSDAQKEFQKEVEYQGHTYILAYDVDSVIAALGTGEKK